MIYAQFKILMKGILTGDTQLPEDDLLVKTLLEYALNKVAVDAEPLKLMTLNLSEPMVRLGPGDYIVRQSKIPLLDSDEIDIDDTLVFAVARLIASNLSSLKGGIHKSIYNREVLDHNAIVYDVISQMRQVHVELDLILEPESCATSDTEFNSTCG
jgi:hypothetical protein